MSFVVSLKNPPQEAIYWMPVIYLRDPSTGYYTPYFPEDYLLKGMNWACPLSAGNGTMVDFRAIIYDTSKNIIDHRDVQGVIVADNEPFEYTWGGAGGASFLPWVIGGILVGAAVVGLSSRRKKLSPAR